MTFKRKGAGGEIQTKKRSYFIFLSLAMIQGIGEIYSNNLLPYHESIPLTLAKPPESQEKALSSAAASRLCRLEGGSCRTLHQSSPSSGRTSEGTAPTPAPITTDSFPGTYHGKCPTPHQRLEALSSTSDRSELTCQRLTVCN